MKTSKDRILTTHVGSMPRPQDVVDMLFAEDQGKPYDKAEYDAVMARNVAAIVEKQKECGVDIPSDGEMSKISYATYIRHRLTGFGIGEVPRATPKDLDEYPEFRDRLAAQGGTPKYHRPICQDAIAIKDLAPLEKDIANMKNSDGGGRRRRRVYERRLAGRHRRFPAQSILRNARRLSASVGERDENRIRNDSRRWPDFAD